LVNGTSAQLGYTVPFMLDVVEKRYKINTDTITWITLYKSSIKHIAK